MDKYYVNPNAQLNGDHEVHREGCEYIPFNGIYLGLFYSCTGAVLMAKTMFSKSNGCFYCCNECHTS